MQSAREQSIRQKIGSIFRSSHPRSNPPLQRSHEDHLNQEQNPFITEDVLRELDRSVSVGQRVRAMKELHDVVTAKRLEEHAVKSIWLSVQDLIGPSQPTDVRHTTLVFLKALIYGQFDDLGILRAYFFQVVRDHHIPEDTQERFDVLRVLTLDGKNIVHLEQDIGRFLLEWMPEFVARGNAVNFVSLLVNFVHYNAAYLDQDVLVGLVQLCCVMANKSTFPNVISLCLDFMNAVVCYSSLPSDSLHMFVITLCNTLNIERFSKKSLDVMLRLLGTHLGRSTIHSMCSLIQERSSGQEALLLRGAVFYISMSMWGVRRVNLDLSFASVLPSIKQAVLSGHTIVVYEISLSLLRLVRAHVHKLHPLEWEAVYDIIAAIQSHVTQLEGVEPGGASRSSLGQCLRELFVILEQLYEGGANIGPPNLFFRLVEESLDTMPIQSVLSLLSYRTGMTSSSESGWVDNVKQCMDKFYRCDRRTAVRVEALKYLGKVVEENVFKHERELMEGVVFPLMDPIATDIDEGVRCQGAQLLVHLLSVTETEWSTRILGLLSSLLQAGMHTAISKVSESPRLLDSKAAVFGLTEALKAQLQCSSPLAAQIFSLLVSLVLQHYDEDCFLPTAGVIRLNIFRCILSLRCNNLYQLGYQDETSLQFTPFFTCRAPDETTPTDHAPTLLDYRSAFNIILACLEKEQVEEVLVPMLRDLVPLLQDRHLTLSALPDLSMLTTHLCDLTIDHTHSPRPPAVSWFRTDVPLHVYPVLSVLATYPTHMDRGAQERLVLSMDAGLVGRAAMTCVSGLGLAGLELQTTMRRLLPRVLHRLGQITATPTMAVPVLAFLSGLVLTPSLHHGFTVQEYLSVFAIALPYTNHQRYPPYVIALAHRVVSQWFVSCRLQLRPTIASFILRHLSHDSTGGGEGGVGVELVDVCRDMLARYTYSNISALPVRSSGAEFLLNEGPSKTWCVGNSLVTITTSRGNGEQCSRCQSSNQSADNTAKEPCSCLCRGWAEVSIQRPTGDVLWVMRLQNWLVSDSRRGLYDDGRGSYDDDILTLHRPIEQHHDSFEVLTEESKLTSSDDDDERDVTPVVEDVARDTTPVFEVRGEAAPTESKVQDIGPSPGGREDTEIPLQDDTKQTETHAQNAEGTEIFLDSFNFSPPLEEHSKDEECPPENEVDNLLIEKIPLGEIPCSPLGESPVDTEDAGSAHVPASWPESVASYSTMTSLEHLPPLLSYDKEEELGRSPPFIQNQLSEHDQLKLHDDFSQLSSTDEDSTTSSSESGDELSSWQNKAGPHPRLKHKSLSLPEDSPSSLSTELPPPPPPPTLLTPFTIVTSSPTPQRRKSAPAMPLDRSPAQQRKRPLYTHQPQRGGQSVGEESHDPSSVFLQLYHGSMLAQDTPLLLPNNESIERAVKNLHRIHPYETHRIGVVYVAPGQSSETEILANTFGSSRYLEFLGGLGSLLRLPDVPRRLVYLGGLDQSGTDGKVTYCYHDNISQVLFHVATLMPTDLISDPQCSCKKLHIGNDFVTIVYNDSGSKYKFGTIKGQFNFAEVVVEPRPGGVSLVGVAGRPEIQRLVSSDLVFVSDTWLPQLVRQKALQADLASHVVASETRSSEHYLTNWLGRLRQIRKIREKCSQDNPRTNLFTDYT